MKTMKMNFAKLRNDEHLDFHTECKDLVSAYGANVLGIESVFRSYLALYNQEQEVMQVMRRSIIADEMAEADNERDTVFRGLCSAVMAATNHYIMEKRSMAKRLAAVFEHYANMVRKPYEDETNSMFNLVHELQTNYGDDLAALGITEWVSELNIKNIAFDFLMKGRMREGASKTDMVMREVRMGMDTCFRSMCALIDALITVNGPAAYEPFVRALNIRVEKYDDIQALRYRRVGLNNEEAAMDKSMMVH